MPCETYSKRNFTLQRLCISLKEEEKKNLPKKFFIFFSPNIKWRRFYFASHVILRFENWLPSHRRHSHTQKKTIFSKTFLIRNHANEREEHFRELAQSYHSNPKVHLKLIFPNSTCTIPRENR